MVIKQGFSAFLAVVVQIGSTVFQLMRYRGVRCKSVRSGHICAGDALSYVRVSKVRPSCQMRPVKPFHPAREAIL